MKKLLKWLFVKEQAETVKLQHGLLRKTRRSLAEIVTTKRMDWERH